MKFENFYIVGGYRFPAELGKQAEADLKFKYLGKITADDQLDEYVLDGNPCLTCQTTTKPTFQLKKSSKYWDIYNPKIFTQFSLNLPYL